MEVTQGTPEVFEFKGSSLTYDKEHVLGDEVTVEVGRQGDRCKVHIRVGGRVGKLLHAKQNRVKARRKV